MTQSALSQIIRSLEERIGVRLLHRTTRSVTPTQAGERLFLKIGPRFDEIDAELSALSELREKPAGTIRITATEYAAQAILLPALAKILPKYPEIKVEVLISPARAMLGQTPVRKLARARGRVRAPTLSCEQTTFVFQANKMSCAVSEPLKLWRVT
jgi:DNA-binding transcriptional LysR family regulator